jgi:hypothetical protein
MVSRAAHWEPKPAYGNNKTTFDKMPETGKLVIPSVSLDKTKQGISPKTT